MGSRSLALWFGAPVTGDAQLDGSPLDRAALLALMAAGLLVLIKRRVNWSNIVADNKWLFIFFLYLGLSTLWSEYPFVAFKRWIKDVGNILIVLVILGERNPVEAVKAVFLRCAYVLVPMSVLVIKYFPDLGRSYSPWTGVCQYCGVCTNKNMLGVTLIVYGIVLFWEMLELHDEQSRTGRKFGMSSGLLLIGMVAWLFVKTDCKTGLVCAILGIGILLGIRLPSIRSRLRRTELYVVALALALMLLHSLGITEAFVGALGRDVTLTGRTAIWERALSVPINPLFGTGYYSFWIDPNRVEKVTADFFFSLDEAHNGYLETYLNEGLIGVFLLAVLLISAFWKIRLDLLNDEGNYHAARLAFLVVAIVYDFTEAAFNRMDFIWFILLLAMVGRLLPLPAVEPSRLELSIETWDRNVHAPR